MNKLFQPHDLLKYLVMFSMLALLSACGGGGSPSSPSTQGIGGGGVKGPLANAIVTAYAFDGSAAGFKGAVIDTGITDNSAKISGLNLTLPLTPPYILEFTSDSGTTDITTGLAPVITTMRTVLTQALLDTGEDIYATPLTTMATDLAVANADSNVAPFTGDNNGTTTAAEFVAALPVAASQVASTLGFGIDSTVDIFDTPPLVDATTVTTAEQTAVAAYRAAVEAVTAVVYAMDQQSTGTTPDAILSEMTADLADGAIDGTVGGVPSTVYAQATLDVLNQDPATLPIPNDLMSRTVGDVEAILVAEKSTTGATTSTTDLSNGTINTVLAPAIINPDLDGDGTLNVDDAFPTNASEITDTDGDGTGDNADTDDDNDGWLDSEDDFPTDATQFLDATLDRDGDGIANGTDPCPLDATDACVGITDTDSDGVADSSDNCPTNSNPSQTDMDTDGIGDACDSNIDGDAQPNSTDAFPYDASETVDSDGDGVGNNADADDDNDGLLDAADTGVNPADGTTPCSVLRDCDGDGFFDNADAFPVDATETVDTDTDGVGDNADNCPATTNANQLDTDSDGAGNACDSDDDNDGLSDTAEAAAGTNPLVADTDGDSVNDGTDAFPLDATETIDTDTDGVGDNADNCPATTNANQLDTDSDGAGNACDNDDDNDGLTDAAEAIKGTNPLLADTDGDTVGDATDNCPLTSNTNQADTDGNGIGDACDTGAAVDATGVWNATLTVTGLSPFVSNGCAENDPVSTVKNMYLTMTQTGTSLSAKTVWGDSLTGSIDAAGAFILNGVTTRNDPTSGGVDTDTISVSGTLSSATVWTGTATITEAFTPSGGSLANQCMETVNMAGAFIYKHTGSEDYTGVYGIEAIVNGERATFAMEAETAGATLSLRINNNDTGTGAVDSYDPATGFFSHNVVDTRDFADGTSQTWTDNFSGIFVRAPGDGSGPQISFIVDSYGENFSGPDGTGTSLGFEFETYEGYGKRVNTQAFTRSLHYRPSGGGGDRDDVFMGIMHPPLKGDNTNQYIEVLDTDGSTRLCARSFDQRYREFQYLPRADMVTEQFQSKAYSAITCNTFDTGIRIVDGMSYTVRIRDMGADGAIDAATSGGDDTTLFSQTHTAVLHPSVFTEKPSANGFVLNNAQAPSTMKRGTRDGAIELFGYFNLNKDMVFGWAGLADADSHQVQIRSIDQNGQQYRLDATAPTAMATIPAGTLSEKGTNQIRLRAIKTDAGNGAVAYSNSKWLLLTPGIRGNFNVELGGAVPPTHDSFQLFMMAGMGDGLAATITDCTNNSLNWTCNGGTIDYTTNTVSLSMTDDTGSLGTITLDFTFTDSANGTVSSTSAGITLVPTKTHIRAVNPGLVVRSLQPSGGGPQQSLVALRNEMGGGPLGVGLLFDKAEFKRNDNADFVINGTTVTGVNSKVSWCETTGGCTTTKSIFSVIGFFQQHPTDDGVAQKTGNFLSDRTDTDWGLGAGLLDGSGGGVTYKSIWRNSTDSNQKWVFKTDYTAPDASVLVTPIHNQVTVNLSGGDVAAATGVGESATPIDVSSQPAFGLTWTGSVPAGGEWQIRVTTISGTGPFYPGREVRSAWMSAAHPDLTDNGDGTWTWTNGNGIALSAGETVAVQIRAREGSAFTMLGAQRTGTTDDRVYLMIP